MVVDLLKTRSDAMRTMATALSILLSAASAQASTTQGDAGGTAPAAMTLSPKVIQLAGSFNKSPNKLADKYLSGQAGGRYGIGGSEPRVKYFKNKIKKNTALLRRFPREIQGGRLDCRSRWRGPIG
jgi:hypothetical protein